MEKYKLPIAYVSETLPLTLVQALDSSGVRVGTKSMREVQASGDANFNTLLDSDTVSFEGLDHLRKALNNGDQQDG